jgi:hypothetical protein
VSRLTGPSQYSSHLAGFRRQGMAQRSVFARDVILARGRLAAPELRKSSAVQRARELSAAYTEANSKMPAWALPGHRSIDHDGNPAERFATGHLMKR